MKIRYSTLVLAAALMFSASGCGASEPDYWDFYRPAPSEEPDDPDDPDDPENPEDPDVYTMQVMSFNVRYVNAEDTGDKSWDVRKDAVVAMVADRMPDIMGVQEARLVQRSYMDANIAGYKSVAVGRNNGKLDDPTGEFMAIYYRTETVKIEDWGTFWLSETPDAVSKGWDANNYRTATYGTFTHIASGEKFFVIDTHLDHIGLTARAESMKLIEKKMGELNPGGLPMLLMADFNTIISDAIFNGIKEFMGVARNDAKKTDYKYSYNSWGVGGMIIDHIFYSGFKVLTFETVDEKYAGVPYISDHYPVTAEFQFETE